MEIDGFMRKDELIAKLRSFRGDGPNSEWDRMAASDLADYLEQADIPDGVTKNILSDLARYIAEGVEEDAQLSRNDPKRKLPLFSCDADSYTELLPFESNEYLRFMATKKAAELLERITEFPGFGQALQSYWDAQYTALRQAADKFTKKVWQEGLCDIVRKSSSRRLHGQFGKTKLTTNYLAARVGVVFWRGSEKKRVMAYLIGVDGNRHFLRPGGGQEAPLAVALSMIDEVIASWPADAALRAEALRPDN